MARPTSKTDLVEQSQANFKKLDDLVDSFSDEEKETNFPEGTLNRNIRDVLAHLYHWHLMVLSWYRVGMQGGKPDIPAKGYNWRTIPDLNRAIREKYCTMDVAAARNLLQESYHDIQQIIESHSNEELFERGRYAWTGNNALSVYLIGAVSSHFEK